MAVVVDVPAVPVVLSTPAQALVEAVAGLGAQVAAELPGAQALAEAAVLLAQLEALHAVVLTRVADVDRRRLHTLSGAATTGSWVAAQHTSLDRAQVTLARRLGDLPALSAAVTSRGVSLQAAQRVATALGTLRRHVDRPDGLIDGQDGTAVVRAVAVNGIRQLICEAHGGVEDDTPLLSELSVELSAIAARPDSELARLEAALVLLAQHLEPALLPAALSRLLDAMLPNELERRAADGHRNRGFGLRRNPDGSGWTLSHAELDLECGELLFTVLQAELSTDPDTPGDTHEYAGLRSGGWTSAQDLPACGGPRSRRQRHHDALKNGLRRYLNSAISGLRDKAVPHLNVTVGMDLLTGAHRRQAKCRQPNAASRLSSTRAASAGASATAPWSPHWPSQVASST